VHGIFLYTDCGVDAPKCIILLIYNSTARGGGVDEARSETIVVIVEIVAIQHMNEGEILKALKSICSCPIIGIGLSRLATCVIGSASHVDNQGLVGLVKGNGLHSTAFIVAINESNYFALSFVIWFAT
jgi:hypothetical protein